MAPGRTDRTDGHPRPPAADRHRPPRPRSISSPRRRPRTGARAAERNERRVDAGAAAAAGLPRALEVTAAIVAPTTLATALMFYFGWSHAYYFCIYYGVNSTMLDFTTQDYLMRSVDGLFVPLMITAITVLLVVAVGRLVAARVRAIEDESGATPLWLRAAVWSGITAGVAAASLGVASALGRPLATLPYVPALCLAVGVVVTLWVARLRRALARGGEPVSTRPTSAIVEWMAAFVLVGAALFWAVSDYSANVGTAQARANAAALPTQPAVRVYSARSLGLHLPGVTETTCTGLDTAYRYRYDGVVLVLESGNQYLLLPRRWTVATPSVVLPRSDSIRLEFAPRPTPQSGQENC